MNAENRKKTQEVVKKQIEKTGEQAHEHVKKIKESQIGKMVPTNFENVTISEIAGLSLFFIFILNHFFYMFCDLITATEDQSKGVKLMNSPLGMLLLVAFAVNLVHDAYVYLAKKPLLLSFLLGKIISLVVMLMTLFLKGGKVKIGLLKFILALYFIVFYLFYSYFFSIYISDLKMGLLRADPSDHQAV